MIKWILFDQAGVQVKMFPTKEKYTINNKNFSGDDLVKIYEHKLYDKYRIGKISEKEFVGKFLIETNLNLLTEEFIEFFKKEGEIVEGMSELISKLKKEYKIGAIVNEGKEWSLNKFIKNNMYNLFDYIFISGVVGLRKPDKKCFEYVLKQIKSKPQECLFIDDLEINCKGAESIGIKSIVFKNTNQLKKELKKLKIKY